MDTNSRDDKQQPNVIPSTQRKDGTWRKEVKIRPGYVNVDELPRYTIPKRRESYLIEQEEEQKKVVKQARAKYEGVPVGVDPDEWRQWKEAEEKKKHKKRNRKKKNDQKGHENSDKEDHEEDDEKQEAREVPDNWEEEDTKETEKKGKEKEKEKEKEKVVKEKEVPKGKEEDEEGDSNDPQKQARKIKKKLRQIELLEQKQAEGKELKPDEVTKLAGKKELVDMLENLKIS